jgi:Ca2+-binding EF-hand superfamily protein
VPPEEKKKGLTFDQLCAWDQLEEMQSEGAISKSTLEKLFGELSVEDGSDRVLMKDKFVDFAEKLEEAGDVEEGSSASNVAWRKIVKLAISDPNGWMRRMEMMYLDMDKDKDGEVDALELGAGLKSLDINLTEAQLGAFKNDIDKDDSDGISLDEFLMAVRVRVKAYSDSANSENNKAVEEAWTKVLGGADSDPSGWAKRVEDLFTKFDLDEDGEIDVSELAAGLDSIGAYLSEEQIELFRDDIDDDCSGTITLGEFLMAVRQRQRIRKNDRNYNRRSTHVAFDELQAINEALDEVWAIIIMIAEEDPEKWDSSVEALFF